MTMAKRPALGKGIGALLTSANADSGQKYFLCPIEELRPHSEQPRKTFDDAKMAELVASVRAKGIIQPLVVRRREDHYQIIAGERRWRAAQKAALREIPVIVKDVNENAAFEMALIENLQREDLNPIEEAEAYRYLIEQFELTQEEAAKRVGKERSSVANALRLLRLPDSIRQDVSSARMSMGHARALLALEDNSDMMEARDQVLRKKLSVRETEALVRRIKKFGRVPAKKAKPENHPQLLCLAEELQRSLGTQVKIFPRKRGGKIEITFFSPDDLERLLKVLGVS
jgi:ParB family transcriptional regulator, chromosome partitioning protein